MIYFLGDIHARFEVLKEVADKVEPDDIVIQVGDFGFYPQNIRGLKKTILPNGFPCQLYIIDGNHEDHPYLINEMWDGEGVTEFHPNMFYVPRGTVLELDGYLIGFLGGADSVDKSWRVPHVSWHPEETITQDDMDRLYKNVDGRQLDVLVAHAAPPSLIGGHFDPLDHDYWGLPLDWVDTSSNFVQEAIDTLKPKQFVCGHMHKSVRFLNMRILMINEIIPIKFLLH